MIEIYGLAIESEIPLRGNHTQRRKPDLVIRRGGRRHVPAGAPDGRLVARLDLPNGRGYAHTCTDSGYVLRFHGLAEFVADADLTTLTSHLAPEVDSGWEPILICGNVLAFVLIQQGHCVLHASAVEIDGVVTAFVAASGGGKSTIAATLCAAGAGLVTDDVLRVELEPGSEELRCYAGAPELRLRPEAVRGIDWATELATSVDERRLMRPDTVSGNGRLQQIAFPTLSRTATRVGWQQLSASDTTIGILAQPRVSGLRPSAHTLAQTSRLARSVGAFAASIPWERPFGAELRARLRRPISA